MRYPVTDYATLVFDCDGVVLNSNKVKTEAFYQATLPYGEAAAQAMVDYHVANGGVSRYKKFAYFLEQIALKHTNQAVGPDLEALLQSYADHVREGLLSCEIAPGLEELREKTSHARWLIVSGGDQSELREVFAARGIAKLFDGGIFGSPHTKDEILARELVSRDIEHPVLFLGDSKYDYMAAHRQDICFLFMSRWSEVCGWEKWVRDNKITVIDSLSCL